MPKCVRCGKTVASSTELFPRPGRPFGRYSYCADCVSALDEERHSAGWAQDFPDATGAANGRHDARMPDNLVLLCDYTDDLEAGRDADRLEASGIPCVVEHEHETFNPAFTLKSSFGAIHLLVSEEAVSQARTLLSLDDIGGDDDAVACFIADLSDEELVDIVTRSDEWNAETVRAADGLLQKRGRSPVESEKEALRAEWIREKRTPQRGDPVWMVVAALTALGGGWVGFLIGLGYRHLKLRDATGAQYYVYDHATRWWGGVFMFVGAISALSWLALAVFLGR